MKVAGLILCGGHSQRMGRPKAWLPFGSEFLLQRMVRIVSACCDSVTVVAARGQSLPSLPPSVSLVCDRHPDRGPLEGLASGMAAMPEEVEVCFVASCDAPLLLPQFISFVLSKMSARDEHGPVMACVPFVSSRWHPLTAAYRPMLLPAMEEMLARNALRLQGLCEAIGARAIAEEELQAVDPELLSLWNVNDQADYLAALQKAGLSDGPMLADG